MKSNKSISLDDDIWNDLLYESKNKNIPLSQLVEIKIGQKKEDLGGDIYTLLNTYLILHTKIILLCNEIDILAQREIKKKEEELNNIKKQQEEIYNNKKKRFIELLEIVERYKLKSDIIKLDIENKEEVLKLVEYCYKSNFKIGLSQIMEYKRLSKELGIVE